MKAKTFLLTGCFIASISFFASCESSEDAKTLKGISVTPATVSALELDDELELTAKFYPTTAVGDIQWISDNPSLVSITAIAGTKNATIRAVADGTTKVYAKCGAGTVVSNHIEVTAKEIPDLAAQIAGTYKGTVNVSVSGGPPSPISNVDFVLTALTKETVRLTYTATYATIGSQTVTGTLLVSPDFKLSGSASSALINLTQVTGEVNANALTLSSSGTVLGATPLSKTVSAVKE